MFDYCSQASQRLSGANPNADYSARPRPDNNVDSECHAEKCHARIAVAMEIPVGVY